MEDDAVRAWMRRLFEARLTAHKATAEAVHDATLHTLAERRKHGSSTHPFFWGAFVAAGDWR